MELSLSFSVSPFLVRRCEMSKSAKRWLYMAIIVILGDGYGPVGCGGAGMMSVQPEVIRAVNSQGEIVLKVDDTLIKAT